MYAAHFSIMLHVYTLLKDLCGNCYHINSTCALKNGQKRKPDSLHNLSNIYHTNVSITDMN